MRLQTKAEQLCDVCFKPRSSRLKARTDVTRYLSEVSRCSCTFAYADELKETSVQLEPEAEARRNQARLVAEFESKISRPTLKTATDPDLNNDSDADGLEFIQENLPPRYKVIELLGEGGSGAVVKVLNTECDGMPFAIKVLRPQFQNEESALARFKEEARLATLLDHANIAKVFDFGIGPLGAPYIVMEYLQGEDLESIIQKEGSLKTERALNLFSQLTEALVYAHRRKILHRDIKPSNIMVVRFSDFEVVKIVDFGIARRLRSGLETQTLTHAGQLIGTPEYMAPEHILGNTPDERSDIYSLGCVMYKCLTGSAPFTSKNPIKVMLRHIEDRVVPPSSSKKTAISEDLNYIVMRCLSKDPNYRYWSEGLHADLECKRFGRQLNQADKVTNLAQSTRLQIKDQKNRGIPLYLTRQSVQHRAIRRIKSIAVQSSTFEKLAVIALAACAPLMVTFIVLNYVAAQRYICRLSPLTHSNGHVIDSATAGKSLLLAHKYLQENNYTEAQLEFHKLTESSRSTRDLAAMCDALVYEGICHEKLAKYDEAAGEFTAAILGFDQLHKQNHCAISDLELTARRKYSLYASDGSGQ